MGDLVLDGKNIGKIAIESVRPNVRAVCGVDELARNADARGGFAHTAFEDEIGAQLSADALHFHGLTFVGERRVTCDDRQRRNLREIGDDVFGDAVAEIFLLRIAAHVREWEDGDGRFVFFRGHHVQRFRLLKHNMIDAQQTLNVLKLLVAPVLEN